MSRSPTLMAQSEQSFKELPLDDDPLDQAIMEDIESMNHDTKAKVSHFQILRSHSLVTPEVLHYQYKGSGTEDDPYLAEFILHDPRNPMLFSTWKKWSITLMIAFATLAVAFVSSAYSAAIPQVIAEFHCSTEVATLGTSVFVLGYATGPLLWAPMSELYGRQALFLGTYAGLTAFSAGAAWSQNMWTLITLRFLAGIFGSSALTNAGGVIADMFLANQRGLGMSIFAAAPFLGPIIGPIVGGFVGETLGWRWVEGVMAIFTGALWIAGALYIPETYPSVLLRKRAAALSKLTGTTYISILEKQRGKRTPAQAFRTALARPWALLFMEPIVLLISIYMAIIYGTLYMLFGAFPIVFQQNRGWSQGIGGLAFSGIAVGMIAGVVYSIFDNKRYANVEKRHNGEAPPEARLPPAMVGAVALPIGMFWFAWTNYPSIHWIVCIVASAPFGFGMVLVFLSAVNYLIDSYTIYAASVLAANSVLRSLFGAAFPLFTNQMYSRLGIHWASSIPAFLALACLPAPFIFYKYGEAIRMKCKYSAQAYEAMMQMRKAKEETSRDDNPEGKARGDKGVGAMGSSQSQVPQQTDFAKTGKSTLISTMEELNVSYLTMLTCAQGQEMLDQFCHLIMYPQSTTVYITVAFYSCLIAEVGIGVSLVAVGALSPSSPTIIALGAASTLVASLLSCVYGMGLERRRLKQYAAGRQLGLSIEQQERASMPGEGDRLLREKVHETEDMYRAVMSASFLEPDDLARMPKDPVDLKPGASLSGGLGVISSKGRKLDDEKQGHPIGGL
jgi:multidrug resistance protein